MQRDFYLRDAREVARDLLGRILVTEIGGRRAAGRIVETEAYLGHRDEASHAFRGPTNRTRAMFMIGGHIYVYFIYGVHHCVNVVTGQEGVAEAVLIRALEPVEGIETMRERRRVKGHNAQALTGGPGKLTIAMGIGPELNGVDLLDNNVIRIEPGERLSDAEVMTTPRIGITKATENLWRWVRKY